MPTYTYPWNEREHGRAVRDITRSMRTGAWAKVFRWALAAMCTLAAGVIVLFGETPAKVLSGLLPFILVFLGSVWFDRWAMPRLVARQFRKESPDANHPLSMGLGSEGIDVVSFSTSAHLKWTAIHRVVETPEFFLFYIHPRLAHYLPKRAIPSGEGLGEVRRIARSHATGPVLLLDSAPGTPG